VNIDEDDVDVDWVMRMFQCHMHIDGLTLAPGQWLLLQLLGPHGSLLVPSHDLQLFHFGDQGIPIAVLLQIPIIHGGVQGVRHMALQLDLGSLESQGQGVYDLRIAD